MKKKENEIGTPDVMRVQEEEGVGQTDTQRKAFKAILSRHALHNASFELNWFLSSSFPFALCLYTTPIHSNSKVLPNCDGRETSNGQFGRPNKLQKMNRLEEKSVWKSFRDYKTKVSICNVILLFTLTALLTCASFHVF